MNTNDENDTLVLCRNSMYLLAGEGGDRSAACVQCLLNILGCGGTYKGLYRFRQRLHGVVD